MNLLPIERLRPHLLGASAGDRRSGAAEKSAAHRNAVAAIACARLGSGFGGFALAVWVLAAARLDWALPTGVQAVAVIAAGAVIAGAASTLRSIRGSR